MKCSRPVSEDTEELCRDCSRERRYFDRGAALLIHDDTAKKILYDLKYSNRRDNADMLAYEAAGKYQQLLKYWNPDVIIPVPLHKKRELKRGFNQAEVLARKLVFFLEMYGLNYPVHSDILIRTRQTDAQKQLGHRQRMENIRGAFKVCKPLIADLSAKIQNDQKAQAGNASKGQASWGTQAGDTSKGQAARVVRTAPASKRRKIRTVLLVDDIYTSGATLSECARVLKAAGVEKVYFLTFSIG